MHFEIVQPSYPLSRPKQAVLMAVGRIAGKTGQSNFLPNPASQARRKRHIVYYYTQSTEYVPLSRKNVVRLSTRAGRSLLPEDPIFGRRFLGRETSSDDDEHSVRCVTISGTCYSPKNLKGTSRPSGRGKGAEHGRTRLSRPGDVVRGR